MSSDSSASSVSSNEEILGDAPDEIMDPESTGPSQEIPEVVSQQSEPIASQSQAPKQVLTISELVNGSILHQKKRKGSTVDDIQTDILNKCQMDATAARRNIRGYLKRAVDKGTILVTGGEGITRTYKLSPVTRSELMKGNRASPVKTSRPSGVSAGTTKTLQKTAKAAAKKTPSIAVKRGASSVTPSPSKRVKAQLNGGGSLKQTGVRITPPRKNGNPQIGAMKPTRNRPTRNGAVP